VFGEALARLNETLGEAEVRSMLERFVDEFPPIAVHRGETSVEAYLAGVSAGVPNAEIALEELLLLWLANDNPAFAPFGELFSDVNLRGNTIYLRAISRLRDFFQTKPFFGPDNQKPDRHAEGPRRRIAHSPSGQLDYIRRQWGLLLGEFLERLLRGLDFIKEERIGRIGGGGGPAKVLEYGGPGTPTRIRAFQPGQGLDAQSRPHRKERPGLAGSAFPDV
jgi:hypothetical protein